MPFAYLADVITQSFWGSATGLTLKIKCIRDRKGGG